MTIFRYLSKEIIVTLIALTAILLLIFLSNQLVQYLTRAAAGKIPGTIILQLMMLEIPSLLGLLLPLGFFVAILIAYGRLYAENEITALAACGFGPRQLLQMTLVIGGILAALVALMVLWLNPLLSKQRDYVLTSGGAYALLQTVVPGKFHAISGGDKVFYIAEKSRDHSAAHEVFMAERSEVEIRPGVTGWNILTAHSSTVLQDEETHESFLILKEGHQYFGVPGQQDYEAIEFGQYDVRLPQSQPRVRRAIQAMSTADLLPLNNSDAQKAAELQWRLAIPLMTLVLTVLAVPLSRSSPRQGKYAKLLPAILIYILYANMIFITRDWIANEKIPASLGMWWLHGSVLVLALILFFWVPMTQLVKKPWLKRQRYRVCHENS